MVSIQYIVLQPHGLLRLVGYIKESKRVLKCFVAMNAMLCMSSAQTFAVSLPLSLFYIRGTHDCLYTFIYSVYV